MKRNTRKFGRALTALMLVALLLSLGLALVAVPSARAASPIYVRTDGDDSICDGTADEASPGTVSGVCAVKTIQKGIALVDPGGTVNVADGTYTITAAITVDKGVTITGNTGSPSSVLVTYAAPQSTNNGFEIGAANITIQGIKVVNCKYGFFFDRNNTTYTGCTITHCAVETADGWGIGEIATPSTTISNNTITGCGDKGIYIRECYATSEAERANVTGNTISGCTGTDPAIQVYKSPYTYIYNNTISSTSDKGINILGPNASSQAARVIVEGNNISGCGYDAIQVIDDRYTYIYNNTIGPTNDKGINVVKSGATSTTDRVQVIGNTISETKWPGIQVMGAPYTYVYDNTLTKCNYYGGDGTGDWDYASIHVDDDTGPTYSHHTVIDNNTISDGINGIQTWSNDVTITNNEIYDMGVTYTGDGIGPPGTKTVGGRLYKNSAILVGSNWGSGDIDPTGVTIQCNSIHDNYWGLFYSADLVNGVTAEYNWWGNATGPNDPTGSDEADPDTCFDPSMMSNTDGTGDAVSDIKVDYCPWLIASAPTVSIDAPAEVGAGITDLIVQVDIDCVCNFDAAQFDVTYSTSVLEVVGGEASATGVTKGKIDSTDIPIDMWGFHPVGTPGTARVVVNVPNAPGVSGSGYLAKIHFKVVGSECDDSAISLSKGMLSDKNADEIPATWVNDSIHVNYPLEAKFSADSGIPSHPLEGYAGVTDFDFSDDSIGGTPCGTPPYTYLWEFGDGDTSIDENPTHKYMSAATYEVKLTVTDCLPGGGTEATDTETKTGYITIHAPLSAGCSIAPAKGTATCKDFTFSDTSTGGKGTRTYDWDFGDGNSDTVAPVTRKYATTLACPTPYPTYNVTLKVTDELGTEKTANCTVDVYCLGDANEQCDGSGKAVSALDITKAEIFILGIETPPTLGADANCDTVVNILDVTQIELIIMGPGCP